MMTISSKTTQWGAQLMLLAVAMVWGSSYGVSKSALLWYPVLGFLALRFLITFVVLLPYFLRYSAADRVQSYKMGAPLGILIAAIFLCETYGVCQTSASNAAFLICLCLPFTPVFEWLLLGKPITAQAACCLALAVLGAALLSGFHGQIAALNWGDLLIVAAALLRAIVVTLTRKLAQTNPAPALGLTIVQVGIAGCIMLVLAYTTIPIKQLNLPHSPSFWVNLIYLVLLCTIFAFFAQNWAASRLPPTRVAALMGLEPLFGALYGVLALGETMSTSAIMGAGLMLCAVFGLSGVGNELMRGVWQSRQNPLRSMAASREAGSQ
ncbi:EamA family transporter [Chitinibacter fontanus]|uniref:EamA family transporter n=1 Tax=Chitinibacter fontanus TaxID=1737446 RepID=A0A7D5V9W5_9NEIS|nr:EamA family transporter [Chitinibacter fontanus]QLI81638.1 EamA family transporter [Chitinibacter fontanus]